jgi:hypothetical protein
VCVCVCVCVNNFGGQFRNPDLPAGHPRWPARITEFRNQSQKLFPRSVCQLSVLQGSAVMEIPGGGVQSDANPTLAYQPGDQLWGLSDQSMPLILSEFEDSVRRHMEMDAAQDR